MSTSESGAATVSDEGGTAALSPDRGVSSTSLDVAATLGSTVIVVKSPVDVPSSEAEVTSTSSGTCTSWHLPSLDAGLEVSLAEHVRRGTCLVSMQGLR